MVQTVSLSRVSRWGGSVGMGNQQALSELRPGDLGQLRFLPRGRDGRLQDAIAEDLDLEVRERQQIG